MGKRLVVHVAYCYRRRFETLRKELERQLKEKDDTKMGIDIQGEKVKGRTGCFEVSVIVKEEGNRDPDKEEDEEKDDKGEETLLHSKMAGDGFVDTDYKVGTLVRSIQQLARKHKVKV